MVKTPVKKWVSSLVPDLSVFPADGRWSNDPVLYVRITTESGRVFYLNSGEYVPTRRDVRCWGYDLTPGSPTESEWHNLSLRRIEAHEVAVRDDTFKPAKFSEVFPGWDHAAR